MAQRRMTSLDVIDTDAFLDMGQGSQLLYFHLNARADDDGFVANPKKIMRAIGAADDDYKVLLAKKFLIAFNDGVCVIKHWRINNFIRKDIYKETQYLDLKQTLFIRPNGAYTLTDDGRSVPVPEGHFQLEDVNGALTQRQLSIGKVSKGNTSSAEPLHIEIVSEEEKPKKEPSATKEYNELCKWLENARGFPFVSRGKQYEWLAIARKSQISKTRLKERANEQLSDPFYQKSGVDWATVVSSFNRKA